jgi:hypothetical protein
MKRINRTSDSIGVKGSIPIRIETLLPKKDYSIEEQVLLLFLLSLPPTWDLKQSWVIRQYQGIMGRDKVKETWSKLKLKGHLIKKRGKNFTDVYWIVYETPQLVDGNPVDWNPVHGDSVDCEPVHKDTNIKDTDNIDTEKKDTILVYTGQKIKIEKKFGNLKEYIYICNTKEQDMAIVTDPYILSGQYSKDRFPYMEKNSTQEILSSDEKKRKIQLQYKLMNEFLQIDKNLLFEYIIQNQEEKFKLITMIDLTPTQKQLIQDYRELVKKELPTTTSVVDSSL